MNVEDPAVDGVPEITPVEAASVKPAGSEPVDTTNVYEALPPVTLIVVLNVWLTTPLPRDVVEIASGAGAAAPTTMLSAFVPVRLFASFTWTVKEDVAAVVGVPETTPAAESVKPAGSVPVLKLHV